ncbi:MAG: exodeoxyribonuclease V subunit alpha [Chlorobiaceae bacterium]|nr:exodeoxyribonuclease V subunit alpha [Chlorobiaceae bacterium]NTV60698.1 exodeoxyribonuclease V subunit alpha [Chlorobiaceae bacterium]
MSMEYLERPIDRHFAGFVCRQAGSGADEVFRLIVSMASGAVGKGSSCLDLSGIAGRTVIYGKKEFLLPGFDELMALLKSSSVVSFQEGEYRPLVLDAAGRLYLYRYWQYENELAAMLLQKASEAERSLDEALLHEALLRLFPGEADREEDLQKKAADVALHRLFSVISGGPGTGKTSTVVRILALLFEQPGEGKRIALVAPTGKAAARLKASISGMRSALDCTEEIRAAIPYDVATIHGLLGTIPGSSRFRHSAENPLPFDTVIVDEASMVALPLMHALVTALRPPARLVLLGDREQLASVEAGAVLADICRAGEAGTGSPLSGAIVQLEKNYRFRDGSGIAQITRSIIAGREDDALNLLKSNVLSGFSWQKTPARKELVGFLSGRVIEGYREYLDAGSPAESLELFERFRILCALREGTFGVSGINRMVESILAREGLIAPVGDNYRGRPVLVTVNDYSMRLFNGDTGILFPDPGNSGAIRAFFPSSDGAARSIPPERLPQHETAFAMTVHKSQGSEFDRVLFILSPFEHEILTRELLYTGLTRARRSVELVADENVFAAAVGKRVERRTGLREKLFVGYKGS